MTDARAVKDANLDFIRSMADAIANDHFVSYESRGLLTAKQMAKVIISKIDALTTAGFRILGPDEVDQVTVEKCADLVEKKANSYADPKEVSLWECAKPISVRLYGAADAIRAIKEKRA